jgi:hypothetical protein
MKNTYRKLPRGDVLSTEQLQAESTQVMDILRKYTDQDCYLDTGEWGKIHLKVILRAMENAWNTGKECAETDCNHPTGLS